MPKVSVIIPTFNMAQFVGQAIESVLNQSYRDFEVFIIDDGSTDNTKEIVQDYNDDRIRYIYQENKGLSVARNTGIKESRGKFIAFLDSDDIWLPEKLELQVEAISKSASTGLVSCSGYIIDENNEVIRRFTRRNYPTKGDLLNDLLIKNVVSNGSVALVRKEYFEVVGLFDERLKSAEDWDMWLRIAKFYDVKFIEEPLVKVRVRLNSMSSTPNADKMLQNELQVINKVFSDKSLKRKVFLKKKVYSYRYFYAAIAYKESGEVKKARKCILKSFYLSPFSFFNKPHLLLVLYVIFGNRRFRKLQIVANYFKKTLKFS